MSKSRGHAIVDKLKRGELDPYDPSVETYMQNVADTVTGSATGVISSLKDRHFEIPFGAEVAVRRAGLIQSLRERS